VIDHAMNVVPDGIPHFHGEAALEGWAKVAEAVHAEGGRIFPQLWHLGAYDGPDAPPREGVPAASPSGLSLSGADAGAPLTVVPALVVGNVAQLYRRLAEDIRIGSAHTPDFAEGLRLHRLLDAVRRSAASGAVATVV
jgi:predicted dehydrogenase